jgi:hypothetical protein
VQRQGIAAFAFPVEKEEITMKLTIKKWLRAAPVALLCVAAATAPAQAPTTTTVTGTVYLANGQPGAGTLVLSWPAFTTAAGQLIAADTTTVTIPSDGFVSINLVPNQGSMPAGEYYTAIFYMSDGSTHTQYWVVPAAASATLAALQSQVMPAAQAVQTVSKAYVDQAIAELASGEITASGGSLSGPLFLNGDPTQPLQAADKHYVDGMISAGGGSGSGTVNTGVTNQVAIYSAPGTAVSGSNSLNLSGPAMAAGVQDTLSNFPLNSWACGGSGSDEGQKIDNCITTDIAHTMGGRRYLSAATGAVTWTENPFAPLSVSSGQPAEKGSFELDLSPNATVTADQEVDLGFDSLLDCGNGYPGGGGPGSAGTYIQPEASGYPTSTLIGLGSLATNATAFAVQGSKVVNCGLFAKGLTGMTAVDESQVQEGAKAVNNRMFGFQICFNDDANATDGGSFHFWGNFDNQCEMSDNTDSTVWGARYGYNKQGGEAGIIQNFSAIGGSNPNGTTKIGIGNSSSGLTVFNTTTESLTYGVINDEAHSSGKNGNVYAQVGCSSANAASSICGEDDNAGPDWGSIWMNIQGPNTNFLQLNQPSAAVAALHGDPALSFYVFDAGANSGQATVLTDSPQVANSNLKFGDSYSNAAAWPALDLPAKTIAMTISSNTFIGDEYMTTSDHAGGVLPEGLATNGDIAQQTSVTPHAMALTRHGPGNCIFDGATTANDYVVVSSAVWNSTSAIDCHDSGSTSPPASGPYIGKVQKTVASAPSAPSAPTVTTNCTGTCATTYTYKLVQMANTDPLDHTQSAGSTAASVSGPAALTSSTYNSITAPSSCTSSAPCELYETVGPHTGWLQEIISTTAIRDNGLIGTPWGVGHGVPLTVGVIDPPVHVELGQSGASIATSSTPGVVQPDNATITVDGSGVLSTAAGSVMPDYWNGQGNNTGAAFSPTANNQYASPYPITAQVQFNEMCVTVATADSGGGLYALALVKLTSPICTGSGCATTTEAHWSAQTLSSTGTFCAANAEGNVSVTPGMYYVVTTGSATTAKWGATNGGGQQFTNLSSASAGTSSSGVLGTITVSVLSNGLTVLSGTGGPISVGLSQ